MMRRREGATARGRFQPLLLTLASICGLAVLPARAPAQTLPFLGYSIEQGLSESVAYDLLEDRTGRLWVATGYGLNRFDGFGFQRYYTADGLSENKIHSLLEDRRGRIWIGTDRGVNVLDRDTIRFATQLAPLGGSRISAMAEDTQGRLWLGTDGDGLWLHDPEERSLRPFTTGDGLPGNHVQALAVDSVGRIWIGTRSGLALYEDPVRGTAAPSPETGTLMGAFRRFTRQDGLPDNRVRALLADPANPGRLWVGTFSGIAILRNGRLEETLDRSTGLGDERVQDLAAGRGGDVWIATENGLHLRREGRVVRYDTRDGLPNPVLLSLTVDREGDVWAGTFGAGIVQFPGDYVLSYGTDDGLPNEMVTSIARGLDGTLWIGTFGGGVHQISPDGSHYTFDQDHGLLDNKVYRLELDSRGTLWMGTQLGINLHDPGTGALTAIPESVFPHPKVRDFLEDPFGRGMWVATYEDGLHLLAGAEDGRWRVLASHTASSGLSSDVVMSLELDSTGTLWAATYGGVNRIDLRTGEVSLLGLEQGLPSNAAIHLLRDSAGEMWVSTFMGAARYRDGGFQTFNWQEEGTETIAYFVFEDSAGRYWMGSNIGLIGFDPGAYFAAGSLAERHRAVRRLTRQQGLVADEMNTGAVFRDVDGTFWLGSVAGLIGFRPERVPSLRREPGITIESVLVSGKPMAQAAASAPSATVIGNRAVPRLSHTRNNLLISYKGISLSSPRQVLYRYRLVGLRPEWTETYAREAAYPSLPPGEYRFEVEAINADGRASLRPAVIRFRIMPPMWMQWWFLVLAAASIVGLVLFVVQYLRVRKMVEMERMRVQIASDLHDDVGASLTELALQTDFLLASKPTAGAGFDARFESLLRSIGQQSRRIVGGLDDIVWSIDARNDTAGDLTDRIQDYAAHLFRGDENGSPQVRYDFTGVEMQRSLPVHVKENLYLIAKEALQNVHKHANATSVLVMVQVRKGRFRLVVHDDGAGERNHRKSGLGLRNMRLRARRMGATLTIDREAGFRVEVAGSIRGSTQRPRRRSPGNPNPPEP